MRNLAFQFTVWGSLEKRNERERRRRRAERSNWNQKISEAIFENDSEIQESEGRMELRKGLEEEAHSSFSS